MGSGNRTIPEGGDPLDPAVGDLFEASYQELRQLARARLRSGGRSTVLDSAVLVNESFLRLSASRSAQFPDKARFLVYAGKVMRSVIVDLVRQRQTERHGGEVGMVTLSTEIGDVTAMGEEQILRVHEALEELQKLDERMARVVEMRYFAGMTESEIARALNLTERTVRRDWQQARLILAEALC
jgi:RNA polymerase sigma factor (TIGR02999 family)